MKSVCHKHKNKLMYGHIDHHFLFTQYLQVKLTMLHSSMYLEKNYLEFWLYLIEQKLYSIFVIGNFSGKNPRWRPYPHYDLDLKYLLWETGISIRLLSQTVQSSMKKQSPRSGHSYWTLSRKCEYHRFWFSLHEPSWVGLGSGNPNWVEYGWLFG